jgi:hypothetical protein
VTRKKEEKGEMEEREVLFAVTVQALQYKALPNN